MIIPLASRRIAATIEREGARLTEWGSAIARYYEEATGLLATRHAPERYR